MNNLSKSLICILEQLASNVIKILCVSESQKRKQYILHYYCKNV